jgi:hypothetical protein
VSDEPASGYEVHTADGRILRSRDEIMVALDDCRKKFNEKLEVACGVDDQRSDDMLASWAEMRDWLDSLQQMAIAVSDLAPRSEVGVT